MMIAARNSFLMGRAGPTPWQNPYVTDGLVAMWDGEWNAGGGVHDANATVWADLIGTHNLTVNSGATWSTNGLSTTTRIAGGLAYSSAYISSTIGAIEACYDMRADSDNSQGRGLVCNTNARSLMSRGVDGLRSRGEASVMTPFVTSRLLSRWSGSVVYATSFSADKLYFGGVEQTTESAPGNWNLPNYIRIGSNSATNTNLCAIGTCHCIRLYSRALTAAEVAANYAIDAARFGL